jgi:predicted NBD/HSP70 family sugar kinase
LEVAAMLRIDVSRALFSDPFVVSTFIALRDGRPRTLTELAESRGFSRPTAAAAIRELEQAGWVERLEPHDAERKAGRPATRFRLLREAGVVAGVDVGVHKVLVSIRDLGDSPLGELRVDLAPDMAGADRVDAVAAAVRSAMDEHAPGCRLIGVGVGAPGIVDRTGRITLSRAIPEWDGLDLADQLDQALGCRVLVENDAQTATVGEHTYGAGRGSSELIYLVAGFRIAAGVIIGGTLHRGKSGTAGMIGELAFLGWQGAPERLMSHAAGVPASDAAAEIFRAAARGDHEASRAVEEYIDSVAKGLAAIALSVDPEMVVVGGGMSLAGRPFTDALRARLGHHAKLINPRVEVSELGDRATALGGVRNALDYVERQVFDLSVL